MSDLVRGPSMPVEGQVPDFDEGWNAHEIGLDRETVEVLAHPSKRGWALLGWDCRQAVARV